MEEYMLKDESFKKRLTALLLSSSSLWEMRQRQKNFSRPESTNAIAEDLRERLKVL